MIADAHIELVRRIDAGRVLRKVIEFIVNEHLHIAVEQPGDPQLLIVQ